MALMAGCGQRWHAGRGGTQLGRLAHPPPHHPSPPLLCPRCPQAWLAADKAVSDLRHGRMEREELKYKVGWGWA